MDDKKTRKMVVVVVEEPLPRITPPLWEKCTDVIAFFGAVTLHIWPVCLSLLSNQ